MRSLQREKVRPRILCVDDSAKARRLMSSLFQMCGYSVTTADHPLKALELIKGIPIDVVVLDYELPYMNGIALAQQMRLTKPLIPIVLFSGQTGVTPQESLAVDANISKGEDIEILLHKVQLLVRKSSLVVDTTVAHAI